MNLCVNCGTDPVFIKKDSSAQVVTKNGIEKTG